MAKAKSTVNAAGNYTKPDLRKKIVSQVKSAATQGTGAGEWSARKAQLVAKKYKAAGGGYRDWKPPNNPLTTGPVRIGRLKVENDHLIRAKGIYLSLQLKVLALLSMLRQHVQNVLAKLRGNKL